MNLISFDRDDIYIYSIWAYILTSKSNVFETCLTLRVAARFDISFNSKCATVSTKAQVTVIEEKIMRMPEEVRVMMQVGETSA